MNSRDTIRLIRLAHSWAEMLVYNVAGDVDPALEDLAEIDDGVFNSVGTQHSETAWRVLRRLMSEPKYHRVKVSRQVALEQYHLDKLVREFEGV